MHQSEGRSRLPQLEVVRCVDSGAAAVEAKEEEWRMLKLVGGLAAVERLPFFLLFLVL